MANTRGGGVTLGYLKYVLGFDSLTFEKGIGKAENRLGQAKKNFASATSQLEGISTRLSGALAAGLGIGAITAAGGAYIKFVDQSKQLTAQLKLATAQFGAFGQAQEDVNRIAADTRNGVSETASLYANFIRATKEIGGTQDQAARATETFSKALKISGAGTAEAQSATTQFSQALASGVLRGDEFNSIMEASPRLARLLAESLDVPVGSLRKMAENGELTSDKLFRALTDRKFTAGIDAEFRQVPVTFGEAMQQINNAATETFGAFDAGGRFSEALVGFAIGGSKDLAGLVDRAEQSGIEMRATFDGLRSAFEPMVVGASSAFGRIEQNANYVRDSIASIFGGLDKIANVLPNLQNGANAFDRRVFGTQFSPDAPLSNMRGDFLKGFDSTSRVGKGEATYRRISKMFDGYDVLGNKRESLPPPRAAVAAPAGAGKGSGKSSPQVKAATHMEDAGKKLIAVMDNLFPAAKALRDEVAALAILTKDKTQPASVRLPAIAKQEGLVAAAQNAAREEAMGPVVGISDLGPAIDMTDRLKVSMEDLRTSAAKMSGILVASTEEVGDSFVNMANKSLNALSNFANAVKGGGFLEIASGLLNLFGSVAGTGLLGKGLAANFKSFEPITGIPARANGGPVSGGTTYLVGERGPELFTATRSGYIHPNGSNDNGGRGGRSSQVQIVPSPYFDAVVDGRAARVSAPMATQAGVAGAGLAETRMARRGRNRLR